MLNSPIERQSTITRVQKLSCGFDEYFLSNTVFIVSYAAFEIESSEAVSADAVLVLLKREKKRDYSPPPPPSLREEAGLRTAILPSP